MAMLHQKASGSRTPRPPVIRSADMSFHLASCSAMISRASQVWPGASSRASRAAVMPLRRLIGLWLVKLLPAACNGRFSRALVRSSGVHANSFLNSRLATDSVRVDLLDPRSQPYQLRRTVRRQSFSSSGTSAGLKGLFQGPAAKVLEWCFWIAGVGGRID